MRWRNRKRKREAANSPPETGMVTSDSFDSLLRAYLSGKKMDSSKALNVAAFSAAVEFISGVVSVLPIKLYRRGRKDGNTSVNELPDDRRVMLLNKSSGDLVRSHEMMRRFVADFYTDKGGFIYVNRRGNKCESLHYVDPAAVSILKDETDHIFKRALFMVDGRTYYPWQFIYACRNSTDGVTGHSMIDTSGDILSTAYKTQVFEEALMDRGGNRRGYLQTDQKVRPDTVKNLKEAFSRMYQGENTDNIVVLNDGIKFQEASETSQEMQLAENKERQTDDVLSLFLIPPSLIQGGAFEDDHKKFINYALMPLLAIIEDALNNALLLENEKKNCYFSFDLKELTKANMKDRWTAWATAKKNGLVNADEFRRFEDMEPLGMNYINLGLQDVLMDPSTQKIIVPNMATVINPDDLQPARAPREPNAPISNDAENDQNTEETDKDNLNDEQSNDDKNRDPEGGEENGDQSKR